MLRRIFQDRSLEDTDNYYQAMRAYQLDPDQKFVDVKNRIGLSASAVYAQLFFANLSSYKRLRREIELHQKESNPQNKNVDILLVTPPAALSSGRETRRFVQQAMGLGTSGQFAHISQAMINSNNAITGAKRLFNIVDEKRRTNRSLIIVSYSFGSALVRVMLDQMHESEMSFIKGWLNISGPIFGTPRFHCSDKSRIIGRVSRDERSFSMEQRYFGKAIKPNGIKTLHILGLKNNSGLRYSEEKQRELLKPWGPNDGWVPFANYQYLDQPVLPLLDQGHHIDLSLFPSTFVKILSSMVSTIPQQPQRTDARIKQGIDFI